MRFILVIVTIAGLSAPVIAQAQRLPRTSFGRTFKGSGLFRRSSGRARWAGSARRDR